MEDKSQCPLPQGRGGCAKPRGSCHIPWDVSPGILPGSLLLEYWELPGLLHPQSSGTEHCKGQPKALWKIPFFPGEGGRWEGFVGLCRGPREELWVGEAMARKRLSLASTLGEICFSSTGLAGLRASRKELDVEKNVPWSFWNQGERRKGWENAQGSPNPPPTKCPTRGCDPAKLQSGLRDAGGTWGMLRDSHWDPGMDRSHG